MRREYTSTQISIARQLFAYLALTSPALQKADAAWGFGHFDLNIPRHCGKLYTQGYAQWIMFSGGIGSGTADLGQPEAYAFRDELWRCCPHIPADALVLEDASTNTGENVMLTKILLERVRPELAFGRRTRSIILVANAYRQRRVWLTCRKHLPELTLINAPPATTFDRECRRFADKAVQLPQLLLGEVERLQRYADAGYIVAEQIPDVIYQCYTELKRLLQ